MRIIDADALKEAMYQNGGCGICSMYVDDAPTIAAIPVEWLRKEEKEMLDNGVDADADVVDWLILTWQKEQEANQ